MNVNMKSALTWAAQWFDNMYWHWLCAVRWCALHDTDDGKVLASSVLGLWELWVRSIHLSTVHTDTERHGVVIFCVYFLVQCKAPGEETNWWCYQLSQQPKSTDLWKLRKWCNQKWCNQRESCTVQNLSEVCHCLNNRLALQHVQILN